VAATGQAPSPLSHEAFTRRRARRGWTACYNDHAFDPYLDDLPFPSCLHGLYGSLASILLASCGGGGSSSGNGGGGPVAGNELARPPQTPQVPQRPQSSINARPRPGINSVTHSSNLDSSNVTTDKVTLSTFRISNNESGFIVKNGDNWTKRVVNRLYADEIFTPTEVTRKYQYQLEDSRDGEYELPVNARRGSDGLIEDETTGKGISLKDYVRFTTGDVDFHERYNESFSYNRSTDRGTGRYTVKIYMKKGHTDSDYLGYGYWSDRLRIGTDYGHIGVFAHGSDP